jgi:exopolysaccharide biosynthesis polyprenyl glycosylphosphotransferase
MPIGYSRFTQHWRGVAGMFLLDGFIVWAAFAIGIWLRFGELPYDKMLDYFPGIAIGSLALPVILYVGGYYSGGTMEEGLLRHLRWLSASVACVFIAVLAVGSVNFSARIGRGVLGYSFGFLSISVLVRHLVFGRRRQQRWQRLACLVNSEEDEAAAALLYHLWGGRTRSFGMLTGTDYQTASELPVLARMSAQNLKGTMPADALLVRDYHLADPCFGPLIRQMRYHGVEIISLADACEEAYHAVPLGLVTDNWLFRASSQAGLFYIKKLKRLFDVVAASFFLCVLSPFLALGALAVKISSPGPILFRQTRAGRLERPITVIKLRTMHLESESAGPQWSGAGDDRIFPAGHWLRKFRIDEIPQLLNVLRGDMSFVGPRPEQSQLVDWLDHQIPFYRERLLIQPGLTGWAQVQYPYGASVEDAARKLEYDLYYMKHMSLFLDFFILIETVKIVLLGGVRVDHNLAYSKFREDLHRSGAHETAPAGRAKAAPATVESTI